MINKKLYVGKLGRDFSGKTLPHQKNRFLAMGAVALLTGTIATAISSCNDFSSPGLPINSGGNAGSGATGGTTTGGFGGTTSGGSAGFGGEGAHAGEGGLGGKGGSAGSAGQGGVAGSGGQGGLAGSGGEGGTQAGGNGGAGGQGGVGGQGGSAGQGGVAGSGGGTTCPGVFNETVSALVIPKTTTSTVGGYGFTYVAPTTGGINMDIECAATAASVFSGEAILATEKVIDVPGDSKRIKVTVTSRNTFDATCNIIVESL